MGHFYIPFRYGNRKNGISIRNLDNNASGDAE